MNRKSQLPSPWRSGKGAAVDWIILSAQISVKIACATQNWPANGAALARRQAGLEAPQGKLSDGEIFCLA